jgi:hypothetical protein
MTNFVGPGREPALPAELAKLAENGQEGIGRRLIREIVEFGAADPELPAAPARLAFRDLQQQLVQARQRLLPLRTGAAERPDPLVGAGVEPEWREDRLDGGIGWRHADDPTKPAVCGIGAQAASRR